MFAPDKFVKELGGPAECRSFLATLDRKLERAELPPVHWNAMTAAPQAVSRLQEAGFRSTTSYNHVSSGKTSPNLTQEYEDLIVTHTNIWRSMAGTTLPPCPVVTLGWDVTPRCEHVPWPFAKPNYPYTHVVLGNTPERFGRLCRLAADFVNADSKNRFAVFVNAWNEWTEGSHLLPEERFGTAYLTALKAVFSR